jgi:hypothetical protein
MEAETLRGREVRAMNEHKELLHVRFAESVMGWRDVEPERVDGRMRFFGTIHTNRGPQRREVPDYSNDLGAMWAAEHYLKSIGLAAAYLATLAEVVGARDLSNPEDLFRLVSASPAERCEAALHTHQRAASDETIDRR